MSMLDLLYADVHGRDFYFVDEYRVVNNVCAVLSRLPDTTTIKPSNFLDVTQQVRLGSKANTGEHLVTAVLHSSAAGLSDILLFWAIQNYCIFDPVTFKSVTAYLIQTVESKHNCWRLEQAYWDKIAKAG